jgi:N-acetylglucosamine-6-phosphate deacetylase
MIRPVRLGVEAAVVGGRLVRGDLEIEDGRVAAHAVASPDGRGVAIPGLVDLQVNGVSGVDLPGADAEGYRRAGEALLESGVTAYLPTFVTAPEGELVASLRALATVRDGPRILGAHLEGPFISAERLGMHPAGARLDPDRELLVRLLAAGHVRMLTLAPELQGALDLIRDLLAAGVTVSCGHSNATAEEAHRAFDAGAKTVTHLFNAMRPLQHREPGIAGAALARDDVVVQLIADGVHLAPETVKLAWRAAAGRVALVSDSTAVPGGLTREGVLAGSTSSLLDAVRNVHALGAPLEDAVAAATSIPASVLREPAVGTLGLGARADVVVLSDELEIERVLLDGEDRL